MAFGLSGLQFIMSNGAFWRVIGNTAMPRQASNVTPATITAPQSMIATPGGEYILALAGNGNAYLYNSLADTFTAARLLYNQAPISYFGVLGGGPTGSYFLAGGMILSPSLALIGGSERPGVTQFAPPAGPGQPPTQTIVSAGQRNVANVTPLNEYTFLRTTTPVRNNANATTRDDARAIIEMVDIRNGAETVAAIAPENPTFSVFGTQRVNIPPRQIAVDSRGSTYSLTVSGLSVVPLASAQTSRRPVLNARGIVNSNDGTQNYRPGSFITINGSNLAGASIAETIPLPTVLGGSCAVINEMPMPLLSTSDGQISAQLPDNMRPGVAIVQVRSLANAVQSDPVVVTVQK